MVDATVSFAIERLSDFLTQQVGIVIGVKDGVRWLKDELGYLQSSVRYAEARQDEELIRIWINNVREVASEAVIILDRFSDQQEKHAAPKQGVLDCLRSSICFCKKEANLYDIGKEIEALKERIVEIKNRREEYGITNLLAQQKAKQRKRTLLKATSFQNEVDVVGFKDDVQILLAQLVRDDPSLTVISIHGMGGVGKSTLASKLYHSSELSHFKSHAWVCVSEECDIKDTLKKIIKSFEKRENEGDLMNLNLEDLLWHLRNFLKTCDGYLAVIDDIWHIDVWKNIKDAFPDNNNGRIIITTRNKEVAQGVREDARGFVHELRFLSIDESWELFCKRLNSNHNLTKNMEELGKVMVSECRGLPLAIIVLSGLLSHKENHADWLKVKSDLWVKLKGKSAEIEEILSLSYDDLSNFHMRDCFLYLARFPEDHNIDVKELMWLWIAEGFISEADERDGVLMEDVAEEYLMELINRNMIQIAELKMNKEVYSCQLHDLVRDLAKRKATEYNILDVFYSSKQHTSMWRGQRRHAINNNGIGEYLNSLEPSYEDLKLCSLAVINKTLIDVKIDEMKLMFTKFRHTYLKVLDLRGVVSEGIPEEIGDMGNLKFLGLMRPQDNAVFFGETLVIPPSIRKLKQLQTLCGTYWTWSKYKFPREICQLKELRHLDVHGLEGRLKIGSQQTKLQTLSLIPYKDWIQIDTLNLINLRTLHISEEQFGGNAAAEYNLESIANLTSLQTLKLRFYYSMIPTIKPLSNCKQLTNVLLFGKIRDPSELSLLPDSVTFLTLFGSKLTKDPMPTLGSLSNLTSLEFIGGDVYMGEKMVSSHDSFPNLQFLKLRYLPNLEEWEVEDGALPSLKGLDISLGGCKKLKTVPARVRLIPRLPNKMIPKPLILSRRMGF